MRTFFLCLILGPFGLAIAFFLNRVDRLEAEAVAASAQTEVGRDER